MRNEITNQKISWIRLAYNCPVNIKIFCREAEKILSVLHNLNSKRKINESPELKALLSLRTKTFNLVQDFFSIIKICSNLADEEESFLLKELKQDLKSILEDLTKIENKLVSNDKFLFQKYENKIESIINFMCGCFSEALKQEKHNPKKYLIALWGSAKRRSGLVMDEPKQPLPPLEEKDKEFKEKEADEISKGDKLFKDI